MKRVSAFANRHKVLSGIGITIGGLFVIGLVGSAFSSPSKSPARVAAPVTAKSAPASTVSAPAAPTAAQVAAKKAAQKAAHRQAVKAAKAARVAARKAKAQAKAKRLAHQRVVARQRALLKIGTPVARQQAIESAQSYLDMRSGFSRAGLIQQLDSSSGEGFTGALATFAVDHVTVNWNEQAVESAKGYMSMGGFSRDGLIQQLSSSSGEGFTYAQAVYAVDKVGL